MAGIPTFPAGAAFHRGKTISSRFFGGKFTQKITPYTFHRLIQKSRASRGKVHHTLGNKKYIIYSTLGYCSLLISAKTKGIKSLSLWKGDYRNNLFLFVHWGSWMGIPATCQQDVSMCNFGEWFFSWLRFLDLFKVCSFNFYHIDPYSKSPFFTTIWQKIFFGNVFQFASSRTSKSKDWFEFLVKQIQGTEIQKTAAWLIRGLFFGSRIPQTTVSVNRKTLFAILLAPRPCVDHLSSHGAGNCFPPRKVRATRWAEHETNFTASCFLAKPIWVIFCESICGNLHGISLQNTTRMMSHFSVWGV